MNCCYNCLKRQPHCHSTCEEYKKFSAENAKRRDERGKERKAKQDMYEHVLRSVEKSRRKNGRIK